MKKVFIVAAAIAVTSVIVSCGNGNAASKVKKENVLNAEKRDTNIGLGAPVVTFDRTEHNFGTVNEGEIVETSFAITNTGKSDLVITNAQATCGCTVPVWPKEAIAPGKSSEVLVKFNTNGKPNKQSKSVTLFTNTANGREIVKITGMVTPKSKQADKQADTRK